MAATSYTTLPSNTYSGLGSQGDLFNAANYGTYDSGVGTLIPNSNQYVTNHFGNHSTDSPLRAPYSNDYFQATYSNGDYPMQQPLHYSTDRSVQQPTYNPDNLLNDYSNSLPQLYNERSRVPNNENPTTNNTSQPPKKTTMDNDHKELKNAQQSSQTNMQQQNLLVSSDNQMSNNSLKQVPSTHKNTSSSTSNHRNPSESTIKSNKSNIEMKPNKTSKMRAAAAKQKEESRDQKQRDNNIPLPKKKPTPPKPTKPQVQPVNNVEHNDTTKPPKRNKIQSNSVPKERSSRRDAYQTDDNDSGNDDTQPRRRSRSQSKKRKPLSASNQEKHTSLPPVRRGRGPPLYDPIYDHPYPLRFPYRGRVPYYEEFLPYGPYPNPFRSDYRFRHHYEDGYDTPPYLPSSHTPYDGFFDYDKRKPKGKPKSNKDKKETNDDRGGLTENETEREDDKRSQVSKTVKAKKSKSKDENENNNKNAKKKESSQDEPDSDDLLELWRQERNDYLKNKFRPTVHDVLYSQQWMKTDSYLENQRRRALREIQGYYFPYRKYTLKDYKDLQKHDAQKNVYASHSEPPPNRKERVKKRQEYALKLEKDSAEATVGYSKSPRDQSQKKPRQSTNDEPQSSEKSSKRERALEYAKVQVQKRPQKLSSDKRNPPDPTEQYVNSLFPEANDDGSEHGRQRRSHELDDDDYE